MIWKIMQELIKIKHVNIYIYIYKFLKLIW
jgi:hypothetical protein